MSDTDRPHDRQAELEKKLSDIGTKEQTLASQQVAEAVGLPYADLKGLPIDPEALKAIPEEQSRAAGVALIQATPGSAIAVTLDPRIPEAKMLLEELGKGHSGLKIFVVSSVTMQTVWSRYATIKTVEAFEVGAIQMDTALVDQLQDTIKTVADLKNHLTDISATQLLEILVAGALATKASDIHLEPETATVRLRYRLDGLLHDVTELNTTDYTRVLNRVKVISQMKLNITKAPQDGRFTIRQKDTPIEVRVSILPGEHGESIVMRLLDPRTIHANLTDLGMREDILLQVRELLAKPQGALFTTGPTGSGKTTTLYAFVNELNKPDTKIITVEDPVEYHITGITQTQVEPSKGYTFASGLRSIVRQDPDIILIGEIRDLETAQIALDAALTGHLVLSTLHTNDAAGTIPRLVDLGIKPETIAPALTMAMAQRLVRRLCEHCKKKKTLTPGELKKIQDVLEPVRVRLTLPSLEDVAVYEPAGCSECNNTGYRGRIGVYEVFTVTRDMERLILTNPPMSGVRDQAIADGMITILQDGYVKLIQGMTSLEEIARVLG